LSTKTKILVANRGEIAIRIIRAIQELNYEAVAIYETPDQQSKHIRIANEAVWIGDGPRSDYLNIEKVIKAAKRSGATAIHPGYGFLAENPLLAKACEEAEITFIGPTSEVILLKTPCWPRHAKRRRLPLLAPLLKSSKNSATR